MRAPSLRPRQFRRIAFTLAIHLTLALVVMASRGSGAVVVSCGFEPAGDTWSFQYQGPNYANAVGGLTDSPSDQRIRSGQGSWSVKDATTSTLTFSEVLLSGWSGVTVNYHVSSTATSGYTGHATTDYVTASVGLSDYASQSPPVFSTPADITLKGYGSGVRWAYGDGSHPQIKPVGWRQEIQPTTSGLVTSGRYTDFTLNNIPSGTRSLALQIALHNSYAGTYWNLDDVTLEGNPTSSVNCYWDGDGQGTVGGGGGAWDNAANRWASGSNDSTYSKWNSGNGDNAFFTQAGGEVTIAAGKTVAARSLTFNANGYTIKAGDSGSKLVLTNGGCDVGPDSAGANTIKVTNPGDTATVDATILGNPGVGLVKAGAGTLVLGGGNTYTGETAIRGGVVSVSASSNLGAVGAPVSLDGGTLRFTTPVDLMGDHPLVFRSGGGAIDTQGNNCAASASGWSGTGAMTKLGAGVLQLDGAGAGFSGTVNVQQGTLRLNSSTALSGCSTITVDTAATLDVATLANYHFGTAASQMLQGAGTIVGNLQIDHLGVHDIGCSPDVQHVRGSYVMDGTLLVEVDGGTPGNGATGYDQIVIADDGANHNSYDVSLSGTLSLAWNQISGPLTTGQLWIIRNDTAGSLSGAFSNYRNGAWVGTYEGLPWHLYYGADASTGTLTGGNDVLLAAAMAIPEPGSLVLLLILSVGTWFARWGQLLVARRE